MPGRQSKKIWVLANGRRGRRIGVYLGPSLLGLGQLSDKSDRNLLSARPPVLSAARVISRSKGRKDTRSNSQTHRSLWRSIAPLPATNGYSPTGRLRLPQAARSDCRECSNSEALSFLCNERCGPVTAGRVIPIVDKGGIPPSIGPAGLGAGSKSEQTTDRDIRINILPVNTHTASDQPPISALLWRRTHQPRKPLQWRRYGPAIAQRDHERIPGESNFYRVSGRLIDDGACPKR